jgi:hypothetical protein
VTPGAPGWGGYLAVLVMFAGLLAVVWASGR